MAQFIIYKSTDASAPVLTGEVGSLTALLKACLVDGYGAKAAAGWTEEFTGTNKSVFRPGAGTRFRLRVQDDAPATAKEARITGYEAMTDVDTGTNPFPTAALGIGGVAMFVARKSTSEDNVARAWIIIATSRLVYVFTATNDNPGSYYTFAFGDIYSLLPSDAYHCLIVGRTTENSSGAGGVDRLGDIANNVASAFPGQVIARGYTGLGGAVQIGFDGDYPKQGGVGGYYGVVPFPNPSDGAFVASRVWLHDSVTTPIYNLRGRLTGLWIPCHAKENFTDGDTITGSGELAGKTFLLIKQVYSNPNPGVVAVETSNTLEVN